MVCDSNVINANSLEEPNIYIWNQPYCGGQPVVLDDNTVYYDYSDLPGGNMINGVKTAPFEPANGMLQGKSVYVPPHMDLEWQSFKDYQVNRCSWSVDYGNHRLLSYDTSDAGFFKNLYNHAGEQLGECETGPMGDTINDDRFLEHDGYSNRMRVARVRQKDIWERHKINCCRGIGDKEQCGIYHKDHSDGACDNIMNNWCHWNYDHPDCACITSEILHPACFDTDCRGNAKAYKTVSQRNIVKSGCPSKMECNQIFRLSNKAKNNIVNGSSMIQSCNVETGEEEDVVIDEDDDWPAGIPRPDDPKWKKLTINTKNDDNHDGVIFMVLFFIVIYYLSTQITLFDKKKTTQPRYNNVRYFNRTF